MSVTGLPSIDDLPSMRPTADCGWRAEYCPEARPKEPTDLELRAPGDAGTFWRPEELLFDPKLAWSIMAEFTFELARRAVLLPALPLKVKSGADEVFDRALSLLRGLKDKRVCESFSLKE